jgi:HEPN domain-containing protein
MMRMDPGVANWLRLAEHELQAAKAMLEAGQNLYVVFTCHQAAEKALKALVARSTGAHPPRTHDLPTLAALARVAVPEESLDMLGYLTDSFMDVRYPTDLDQAHAQFPVSAVTPLVARTEELVQWVRSHLQSET